MEDMEKKLTSLFESNKQILQGELQGLTLPKDAQKIEAIVSEYLSNLLDEKGDFRQSLNQSEDYIMQAAYLLLNSQQKMIGEITSYTQAQFKTRQPASSNDIRARKEQGAYIIGGTAAGSAVGGILIGTWGALFGAIAGTAIVLYYFSSHQSLSKDRTLKGEESRVQEKSFDPECFVNIVQQICESVDGLMETYRVQVKRIENVYEQREKPNLQSDYSSLLNRIENVYSVATATGEVVPYQLKQAIEIMAESLENYGLKIINGKIVTE